MYSGLMTELHTRMMQRAIELAQAAGEAGEIPVGAVIYLADGTILGEGQNATEAEQDVTLHAEIVALRAACKAARNKFLPEAYLAVTLEPCAMCAQALSYARLKTIYFGTEDVKSGGTLNGARVFDHAHHKPSVVDGFMAIETAALLPDFFKKKRI